MAQSINVKHVYLHYYITTGLSRIGSRGWRTGQLYTVQLGGFRLNECKVTVGGGGGIFFMQSRSRVVV